MLKNEAEQLCDNSGGAIDYFRLNHSKITLLFLLGNYDTQEHCDECFVCIYRCVYFKYTQ